MIVPKDWTNLKQKCQTNLQYSAMEINGFHLMIIFMTNWISFQSNCHFLQNSLYLCFISIWMSLLLKCWICWFWTTAFRSHEHSCEYRLKFSFNFLPLHFIEEGKKNGMWITYVLHLLRFFYLFHLSFDFVLNLREKKIHWKKIEKI